MKHTRLVIYATLIAFFACTTIIFSSCSNACKNTNCQNTGQCNGGSCSCPIGYSGNLCQLSSITFVNNAITEIYININGVAAGVIPPGDSYTSIDTGGMTAVVNAYTYGTLVSGVEVGDTVKWTETYTYPTTTTTGGALIEDLNVGISYFYLKVVNNDPTQTVDSIMVNYGGTNGSATAYTSIPPANGISYGIGYYQAYTTTSVTAYGSAGGVWSFSNTYLGILSTNNQSSTITIP